MRGIAEFAGRFHFVPADADDGALSRVDGIATTEEGAYLVIPDEFGMRGHVSAQLASDLSRGKVVEAARIALRSQAARFEPRTVGDKFQRHIELGAPDWYYLMDRQAT